MTETTSRTPLRGWLLAALFCATVLAGAGLALKALHARGATGAALPARPALTVSVTPLEVVGSYTVRESFVGRIEPARETRLSAERAGLVVEILVEEGEAVRAGQVIARMDPRPLKIERTRLVAERTGLEAEIALALRTVDRRKRLVGEGWNSGQTYDEARFAADTLAARREAVLAGIARIDLDLEKSVIRAPFDGTIADRMTDEGTVVAAGTPLVRLQETGRPQARIGIPSSRVVGLTAGRSLWLDIEGRPVEGRVVAITRDVQAGTRTVPVLVDIVSDAPLVMGKVVRLTLERDIAETGAWVPLSALQEAERGLWSVQTVAASERGQIVRREAVEILHVDGERAFVRGTFADGARVVPVGAHKLSNGQLVRAEKAL